MIGGLVGSTFVQLAFDDVVDPRFARNVKLQRRVHWFE